MPRASPVARAAAPRFSELDNNNPPWTRKQLLQTYKAVISQTLTTRFCIFIDGLDEYDIREEKAHDLVQAVRELSLYEAVSDDELTLDGLTPSDLDDFFLQMLRNIDSDYRKQALRTFDAVTSALHPLPAMLFWYLYEIDEKKKYLTGQWSKNASFRTPSTPTKLKENLDGLRR